MYLYLLCTYIQIHANLTFDNVLYDDATGALALIMVRILL